MHALSRLKKNIQNILMTSNEGVTSLLIALSLMYETNLKHNYYVAKIAQIIARHEIQKKRWTILFSITMPQY